jgi:hypothetical protein
MVGVDLKFVKLSSFFVNNSPPFDELLEDID